MAQAQEPERQGSLLDRDGLISGRELAAFLGIEYGTLDQWASRGGGPAFVKVGIHRKYDPDDVRAWLKSRRRDSSHNDAA